MYANTITGYMIKCQDMMTTNTFSENSSTSQCATGENDNDKMPEHHVKRQKVLLKWTICNLEHYFRILFMWFHLVCAFCYDVLIFLLRTLCTVYLFPFESVFFAGWVMLCCYFFNFVWYECARTHSWFVLCATDAHSFPLFASIVTQIKAEHIFSMTNSC